MTLQLFPRTLPGQRPGQRAAASLFFFFGAILLAGGILGVNQKLELQRRGVSASGTVVRLVARSMPKGGSAEHAVVRFAPGAGQVVEFEDALGSNPPSQRIGDRVPVIYLPDAPARSAAVDRGRWDLLAAFAASVLGAILVWTSISLWRHAPPAPLAAAPAGAAPARPWHYERWALVLFLVALALVFTPPHNKTGDAAMGAFLCIAAGILGVIVAIADFGARFLLAGISAVVAVRSGAARGLDVNQPAAAWQAAAGASPRLQALLAHYAHLRQGVWAIGILMLGVSIWLSASAYLHFAVATR